MEIHREREKQPLTFESQSGTQQGPGIAGSWAAFTLGFCVKHK